MHKSPFFSVSKYFFPPPVLCTKGSGGVILFFYRDDWKTQYFLNFYLGTGFSNVVNLLSREILKRSQSFNCSAGKMGKI